MGFVHSLDQGIPCHMKLFPGSINDVTTIMNLAEEMPLLCSSATLMVIDRGFYSERNIRKLYSKDLGFLMPIPLAKSCSRRSYPHRRRIWRTP